MRRDQALRQDARLDALRPRALASIERAYPFEHRLFEGPADRHDFAERLHLRPEVLVGTRKLLELPLGNFYDDIIQRGLEARGRLTRDVVGNLVERVSHREARSNLCDR